jgi:hypothetical protein
VVETDSIIDRGTVKRIPELLLMILTTVILSLLVNQLSGILDSIGRNEFTYDPIYLICVLSLFVIILILYWELIQRVRQVKIPVVIQLAIDSTNGEIPYIRYMDHEGNEFQYKAQLYLANAFKMMSVSLRTISTFEKHGARTWMDPSVPFENSEREGRIRQKIIEFYANPNNARDNPVYELFDRVLTDYLQNTRYMAENVGIQEKEWIITHEWRDNELGGFTAKPASDIDPMSVPAEDDQSSILKLETLFVSDSDSRWFQVRIPEEMEIIDISSENCRGFSISGKGIDLVVSYESIRQTSPDDSGLITDKAEAGIVFEQLELVATLKMTIQGYVRYRNSYHRLVRWAEDYIYNITTEFDWPGFKAKNGINQFERLNLELEDDE